MINNYDSVVSFNLTGTTCSQKQREKSYMVKKRTWISLITMLMMLFSFSFVQGQSSANYVFTTGASTLNSMTGSTPIPGITTYPADDSGSTVLPIGFNFIYMGVNYSYFSVNSNGQMRLHTTAGATAIGGTNVSTYSASTVTFAPMAGDNETGTGISYLVTGTIPNRKLIIEWNNFYAYYSDPQTSGNMQLVLNEGTGVFEFIYGGIKNSNSTSTTRSIFHSSSNTTNSSAFITVGATPTQNTTATSPTTNSFAASVLIANLANTFYKFTPASTVEAPTALTFSGVTSAGTTVNWVDNSTTEYGFLVTRATDAGFTSGVVTSTVASTTGAATGQAYTSVQTGLLPSTTYYYKVQALSEGVMSADLTGFQITNAPGIFISVTTGNFGVAATWDANAVPTQYDSVTIDTGHTVTIDATGQAANNVIVKGTLVYGTTPSSFAVNGNLTVDAGALVNVFNGTTGKTLTVAGNITNNGTIDVSVGATTAGNLTLNGSTVQTVAGTGTFNTSVIRNLTFSNTSTAIPNINWGFNNISVDNNLNIANAKINLNSNKLIFGTSATSAGGTFTVTNGGFLNGTFSRWWTAAGGGYNTSGPTSVPAGSPAGRYPFYTSTGEARVFYLGRTTPTVGGKFAVTYNNASTMTSGQNITDGSYVVTDRWDGNFVISTDGTSPVAASYWVTIFAPNAFYTSAIGARIIGQSSAISGTHIATSSLPIGQRSGVSLADLTSGAGLYLGVNSADIPFVSVTNGDWETASTWNKNSVPTASDVVYIANNTTVTVNATAAVSNAMTIYAGGTLNVAGSSLGVTTSVTNNGTLNVSGGAMTTTTTVTNNASSTINISGTGALTVGTTMTNNGTINANAGNLTVTGGSATGISNSSTGTFVVAGGTVRQGPVGGGNTTFSNSGILTVSSGTLNINGSLSHSGSQFNQSGGNINIDGNAAGVTANSASSYHLNMTAVVNWTGGTITIVDPHASTTSTDVLYYNLATSSNVGTGHTLRFGDGVSTDAGGNAIGFKANTYVGSGRINYGNLVINGGTGTNRIVTGGTYSNVVLGNLTINSSSEYAPAVTVFVAGDFVNNGTFTQTSTLTLSSYVGTTSAVSTNAQTISGSGVFRNLATSPTANLTSLTVNNSNATGVTLNVPLSVSGTLTMTSGIINTTNTNLLSLGTATAAGTLSGTPSATNMVKGPFARTIASGNTNSTYVLFPVGKTGYAPVSLAPATSAVTVMKAEAFDSNTGTQNAAITNMTTVRRWEAPIVSGTLTDLNVRLGDAGILATSIPVQAPSATGEYTNSFGSVATAVAGATTQSNTAITSANYTGFLSYADSNACSGTPSPGNTLASTNSICLGTAVNLSLQNVTSGTGVTYQWKSSTDGITYTAISGATNATLSVTPSESTYYVCDVTCSAGPSTGTSTAVQIIFSNSIASTTPGTRCGTGTVDLGAIGSSGAIVKWYSAATGGTALGTGTTFTTPSIAATTTYYAGAESAASGTTQFGTAVTGAGTTNLSAFNNYRASAKYQMIYTASELSSFGLVAGNITSIGYNVSSLGSAATNANYTVKIAPTSLSTFANTTFETSAFTTCYGPSTYTHTASGWQIITFSTPFTWDGTSNIIIEVSHDGIDASASANTQFTATAGNTVLYSYNGANNTLSTNRFNVLFSGQVACASARVPVVATVSAPPVFTLSSNSEIICSGSNSNVISITAGASDYDTYTWNPSTGVAGNATIGWTFNPTVTTTYTLTASQSGGALCSTTATVNMTVNASPTLLAITPSSVSTCVNSIQPLVVTGGTIGSNGTSQIGTATTLTSSTGQPTAFCNRFKHYWSQMVYTAAELTAAGVQPGNINAISFKTGAQGSANNVTDFKVRLGNTANNTLTGFTTTGLTQVYSAATYSTVVGVNTITFDTPYVWDGTSNIIVDMRQTGVDDLYNSTTEYTATTGNTVVYAITSTTNAGGSDGYAASAPSATTSLNRLNTTFAWDNSQSTAVTWSPATDLYTDAAATTPYTVGTNASTVYVKSSSAGTASYTATATASLTGCTNSANVNVIVNPLPTVVTVNPTAVCSPSTVDLTAASVTIGSDSGLTYTYWTNPEATNALASPSTVATSGTYYIKGTNSNGCSSIITPVTVTINPLPTLITVDPATVCYPATVDLTTAAVTTGSDSGLTFTYFTDLAATNALTNPNAVTTSGTYYIKGTNANGCSSIASVNVTINVTSAPTGNATQTFCGASNITQLIAVGSGIKWYDAATGGNLLPNITAIGLTNGTTYYASQTVNGCESTDRFAVTVVVNTIPTAPNASAQSFCNSATVADLLPSGSSYNWYSAATGGSALASSDVLSSNTYYVSQTLNGCESARTAVTVTINTTAAPTAADQSFCNSALVANLTATGTNLSWYLASTGGSALSPSTSLTSTTYYVSQTLNGCESSRTAVLVTVNTTSAPTASAQTFCTSATVADLTASGSNLSWYSNSTGGTALTSGTTLSTGIYYVSQNVDGCESPRTAVNVTISTPSTPTGNAVQTIYGGVASDATIEDINVNGSNIVWYPTPGDAAAGTNAIPAGTQLVDGAVYYAVSVVGTCRSAALAVTVTVVLDNASFDIKSLKYYPNPVVDRFTVSYTKSITAIQVYDINGRLVKNLQTNGNEVNVDMSDVAASVYIVKVFADDTMGEFKVVKTE